MKIYDYQGKKNVSGDMIRQLRVKNRMSQNDLAARVQVEGVMLERDSISRIESGTRFVADYELFVFAKSFLEWMLHPCWNFRRRSRDCRKRQFFSVI